MVVAAGFFVLACISSALHTALLVRRRPLERLDLFRPTTTSWRWYQWLTQACTILLSTFALLRASPHIGFLLALVIYIVVIFGPAVAVSTVHNHRLNQSARQP